MGPGLHDDDAIVRLYRLALKVRHAAEKHAGSLSTFGVGHCPPSGQISWLLAHAGDDRPSVEACAVSSVSHACQRSRRVFNLPVQKIERTIFHATTRDLRLGARAPSGAGDGRP